MFDLLPKDLIRELLLYYIDFKSINTILRISKLFSVLRDFEIWELKKRYYVQSWHYKTFVNKFPNSAINGSIKGPIKIKNFDIIIKNYIQCDKCANFVKFYKNKNKNWRLHKQKCKANLPMKKIYGVYILTKAAHTAVCLCGDSLTYLWQMEFHNCSTFLYLRNLYPNVIFGFCGISRSKTAIYFHAKCANCTNCNNYGVRYNCQSCINGTIEDSITKIIESVAKRKCINI